MIDRRSFLAACSAVGLSQATSALGKAAALPEPVVKETQTAGADLAIVNAEIWTLNSKQPRAQAALVRGGRIVRVGSNQEVLGASKGARRFDAAGRTVVPGFYDSHTHLEISSYFFAGLEVDIHTPPLTTLEQILGRLRQMADRTPAGRWVVGRGSFGLSRNVTEMRFPTREELDSVSARHPVIAMAGLHCWSMNTLAFEALGLWDAQGAKALKWRNGHPRIGSDVARDANGVPTGVVTEMFDLLPHDLHTCEGRKAAIKSQCVPRFVSKGITSTATIPFFSDDLVITQELQAESALPLRMRYYFTVPFLYTIDEIVNMGIRPGFGDDMLRFGGVKMFVAGAGYNAKLESVTDFHFTPEDLEETVMKAHESGLQLLLHQAGSSLNATLAAVEKAQMRTPRAMRHRLEHFETLTPEEADRCKRLGVGVSITAPTERGEAGPHPTNPRYNMLIQKNLRPVSISDSTGTIPDFSPLRGLACVAAPLDEGGSSPRGETPSLEEALRMWTIWPAESVFEERDKGTVEIGKLGDFAVLSGSLANMQGGKLFDLEVDATILGGVVVSER